MENKLSGGSGQYFFWERLNINIPETGFIELENRHLS
jgi:hypothetical protein